MATDNIRQFPVSAQSETENSNIAMDTLSEHQMEANRLKSILKLDGNAEILWDRFIPRAIELNHMNELTIDLWSLYCAKKLKPDLSGSASCIWDNLVAVAISEGRFKALHSDTWKEYCIVRAHMDEARDNLNTTTWTYEIDGRNGKQQKSKPEVAHLNEAIRQWRWLVAQLGLGIKSENELKATGAIQQTLDLENFLPK